MKIRFMGAAGTVTGSRHLIETKTRKFLLDCGLFQDKISIKEDKNRHFGFAPAELDFVILSHAHIDHSGNLPRLVKEGFKGNIYCTPATKDLCEVMLADSARIQFSDAQYRNKRRQKEGKSPIPPIYDEDDVEATMKLFVEVPYNEIYVIEPGISFRFTDAGHILGSAAIHLEIREGDHSKRIFYTGDIGRYHDLILREPQPFPQADHILCESTYGDRKHDTTEDSADKLLDIIKRTCVEKGGRLLIPAFSLGRTQEIVYTMDRLRTAGLLPPIPVYVDSPLSVNATHIMKKHTESYNDSILRYMQKDPDPFGFTGLVYIRDQEDSMALNNIEEPCIIISASGMLEAGRIKHHLKHAIEDKRNTILMAGYCAPHTLGAELLRGAQQVRIFGKQYHVVADIESISSYSAHADVDEILKYLSCQKKEEIRSIFLVHGEPEVQENFRNTLREHGYDNIHIPQYGETVKL